MASVVTRVPADFLWGGATASFQIEGATREDGRGASIWDRFCATLGKVKNGDTGDPACDHYHRYPHDVALMKSLGLRAYRFSIAWPRILPEGTGRVEEKGLDFYDRLVDELLAAGIRPFATLYHWDLPQTLQDRWGGWAGRDTAAAFVAYADVVSRRLGDRVKDWITLNEPWCAAWLGYGWGQHAPGLRDPQLAMTATHHLLLGHGDAVPLLRRNSPDARVGITLNLAPVHPATDSAADRATARLSDGLSNRLYLDPVFKGSYPTDVIDGLGVSAPSIQPGDLEAIRAPLDFLGINYYMRLVVQADPTGCSPRGESVRVEGAARTAMDWEIYPEGLHELLARVHRDYAPASMYVTENGAAFDDAVGPDGRVHDEQRRVYLEEHFAQAARAVAEGVPLQGYFVWSLLDNFEWAEGYNKRFGIVYVDYNTQERTVKDSGRWYADMLHG
jgi:beta-glucosidase